MKITRVLYVSMLISVASHASIITVHNTNLTLGGMGGLIIEQFPTPGWDYTGYGFDVMGDQIYTYGTFLDEGCYVTYHGDQGAVALPQYGGEYFDIGYGSFYFEVSTSGGWDEENQRPTSIATGWALMDNSPTSGLRMIESEMTYNIIPEPSSLAMIGLVSGCAVFIRRTFMI